MKKLQFALVFAEVEKRVGRLDRHGVAAALVDALVEAINASIDAAELPPTGAGVDGIQVPPTPAVPQGTTPKDYWK